MYPLVEPRQRPERFLLNRFSPLAESAAFLGLGGFDAAGSVWYPDATRLLGAVPNDGTLTNMDPATDWVWSPELGRWATDFDGTNDYILAPSLSLTTAMSAFAWVNVRGTPSAIEGIIAKYLGDGSNYRSWTLSREADNQIRADFSSNGTYQAANGVVSTLALTAGVWYHVGFTYQAGVGSKIWINGTNDGSNATAPASLYQSTQATWIGSQYSITILDNYCLNGQVSDAVIFSRALSPAEISALADPSNVMLEVGCVPLVLPPRRVAFPAAVAEPVLTYRNYILGGGVI